MIKKISRFLLYVAVVCLRRFLLTLPLGIAMRLSDFLGRLAFYFDTTGRSVALKNLRRAFPEKTGSEIKAICKKMYRMQGKNFAEFVSLPKFRGDYLRKKITFSGAENFKKAHDRGRGTIIISGHFGNWELMGAAICDMGYDLYVTARPFYIKQINDLIVKNRTGAGIKLIMRTSENAVRDIFKALKQNAMVGLLIDQDTRVAGEFVKYFSHDAYTPIGAAAIAAKTGCSVVFAFDVRNPDDTHTVFVEGPVEFISTGDKKKDIIENTQFYTKKIEDYVRMYPHLWVWFHERWKTKKNAV